MIEPSTALLHKDVDALASLAVNPAYWRRLVPGLTVEGPAAGAVAGRRKSTAGPGGALARMQVEGFCEGGAVLSKGEARALRAGMDAVAAAGWPDVFVYLFDEPWNAARTPRARALLSALLADGYVQIPDFWAYRTPAGPGHHGHGPHRDVLWPLLMADRRPVSLTLWVPVTDATLDNGCISVVPMNLELDDHPTDELVSHYGPDFTAAALLHRARALPAPAGHALSWNHFIRNWGGFSSAQAKAPCLALAWEFMRADQGFWSHPHTHFTEAAVPSPPMVFDPAAPLPSFRQRLYLVGRMCVRYLHHVSGNTALFRALAPLLLAEGYPGTRGQTRRHRGPG